MPSLKSIRAAIAIWPCLIVLFALAGGCAAVKPTLNVVYVDKPADSHLQSLDIYSPAESKTHPVILMIHGGQWTHGDKADPDVIDNKMPWFVKQGYVFVSMNYRLGPTASVDEQVSDVLDALHWICQNILLYGGDPTHILLIGHDSGAYLAAIVATDASLLLQTAGLDSNELSVVLLDPPALDLVDEMPVLEQSDVPLYRTYLSVFGPDTTPDNPSVWKSHTPLDYLLKQKSQVVFLIALSGDMPPESTDYKAAHMFNTALSDLRLPVKFAPLPNYNHRTINSDLGKADAPITDTVTKFLANPAGYASGEGLPKDDY